MFLNSMVSKEDNEVLYKYFLGIRYLEAFKKVFRRPNSLFIEHSQKCNLSCSYCYAEVWNDTNKAVDPAEIERLAKEFKFDSYSIYGGDAFFDWKLIHEVIGRVVAASGKKIANLVISTNGISITEDKILFLIDHCENIDLQISMEPSYFNMRVTKNGTHQNDILKTKIEMIKEMYKKLGKNPSVSIVLPKELSCEDQSFEFTLNHIKDIWQCDNLGISWKLEEVGKDDQLPVFINEWIKEESYAVLDPNCSYNRIWQGLVNSGLNKIIMTLDGQYNATDDSKIFSFDNCNAATGSLSIGPDNSIYACHQAAIVGDKSQGISDLSPRYMWDHITRSALSKMNNPFCASCICQYTCGGICFYNKIDSKCVYQRQIQNLAMQVLKVHFPKVEANINRKYGKFLDYFLKNKSDHVELVNSELWTAMINDTASKEDVIDFINASSADFEQLDKSVLVKKYADL